MGRTIIRPPEGTNPAFQFSGTDGLGLVETDAEGNIESPYDKPFVIHYLGRFDPISKEYYPGEEPRTNWVPPEADVRIEFQGASAIAEGSKEVDPDSLTSWSPSPAVANGMQFLRFRVNFDLVANGGEISSSTKRPVFKDLRINFDF